MTFKYPGTITSCTELVLYFLKEVGIKSGYSYFKDEVSLLQIEGTLIKELTVHNGKIQKSITISSDGTVHLKFFDSKGREMYYRSSCGMQVITVNNKVVSKLNYLDDCVLCSSNLCHLFETLEKSRKN